MSTSPLAQLSPCTVRRTSGPTAPASFTRLFAVLQNAHSVLYDRLLDLGRVCAQGRPDKALFTGARLKVSQANMARQSALREVNARIPAFLTPAERKTLSDLGSREFELATFYRKHLGAWPLDAATQDWPGYEAASKRMRLRMIEVITHEKALLYPILSRLALRETRQEIRL